MISSLYQNAKISRDRVVEVPLPNWGVYRVIIGSNPGQGPDPKKDSHHWQIVTNSHASKSQLSPRALLLQIWSNGTIVATNISATNTHRILFEEKSGGKVLYPGQSVDIPLKLQWNLTIKLAGSYILRTQSLAGGTNVPMHIDSICRIF